jgi:hypothetical protein
MLITLLLVLFPPDSISAENPEISLKSLSVLLGANQVALHGMQPLLHEMVLNEILLRVQTTQIGSSLHKRILSNATFFVMVLPHMRYSLLLQHCGLLPRLIQVELQSGPEGSWAKIFFLVFRV